MDLLSVPFLLLVGTSLTLFHVCRPLFLKRVVLLATNAIFLASLVNSPREIAPLLLFLGLSFLLVRVVAVSNSKPVAACSIALITAAFIYLKQYAFAAFVPQLGFAYTTVGLSYVLFRVLHLLVDIHQGALKAPPSLLRFLNYTCFFPAWIMGPILRHEDYVRQESLLMEQRPAGNRVYNAFSRIATGCFKTAIVSALLTSWHQLLVPQMTTASTLPQWLAVTGAACALFTLNMYYNFAGYMDIVIGIATLYGFDIPENFNKPFAAQSFLDFWSRWHITLSNWFKFYIFNPLTKALTHRWPKPGAAPYIGVVAYFVTFTLMGTWHGASPAFIVYGLFLGCGVSGNKLYQLFARKALGRHRYAALRTNALYRALCCGMTFSYFAVALACFWAGQSDFIVQVVGFGPASLFALFAVLALAAAVTLAFVRTLGRAAQAVQRRTNRITQNMVVRQVYLAAKIYVVASLIVTNATAVPEFVYKMF